LILDPKDKKAAATVASPRISTLVATPVLSSGQDELGSDGLVFVVFRMFWIWRPLLLKKKESSSERLPQQQQQQQQRRQKLPGHRTARRD